MGIFPLPIEPDSSLRLRVQSSETARIVMDALVQRRRRQPELIELINVTPDGDRLIDAREVSIPGETLWGLTIREPTGTLERGKTFVRGDLIGPQGGSTIQVLASGYVHGEHVVTGGRIESPTDGQGDTDPQTIAFDAAGNVDTQQNLALAKSIRRVDGITVYYHCSSDVAARTMEFRLRDPGLGVPTGFDIGNDRQVYNLTGPALAGDEDGVLYMNGFGYAVVVDNNVITTSNNTTAPTPFPFWVHQLDQMEIFLDITAGEAADRYAIYAHGEIWFA